MDCYDRILSYYHEKTEDFDSDVVKVWLNKFLVQLMSEFSRNPNYLRLRNCLLLLVNLFFKQIDVPDHFHKQGKSIKKLSSADKAELERLLRAEFNNFN
ncbi:MAG: hypothetical protein ACTSR8_17190 [Promethearchaeota archaeon]